LLDPLMTAGVQTLDINDWKANTESERGTDAAQVRMSIVCSIPTQVDHWLVLGCCRHAAARRAFTALTICHGKLKVSMLFLHKFHDFHCN
jgi:hypothetical protein